MKNTLNIIVSLASDDSSCHFEEDYEVYDVQSTKPSIFHFDDNHRNGTEHSEKYEKMTDSLLGDYTSEIAKNGQKE